MTEDATADVENPDEALSYEEAREQLVGIVTKLEGGAPLEESLALWERGEELAALCRTRLERARQRIEERTAVSSDDPDVHGSPSVDPD